MNSSDLISLFNFTAVKELALAKKNNKAITHMMHHVQRTEKAALEIQLNSVLLTWK